MQVALAQVVATRLLAADWRGKWVELREGVVVVGRDLRQPAHVRARPRKPQVGFGFRDLEANDLGLAGRQRAHDVLVACGGRVAGPRQRRHDQVSRIVRRVPISGIQEPGARSRPDRANADVPRGGWAQVRDAYVGVARRAVRVGIHDGRIGRARVPGVEAGVDRGLELVRPANDHVGVAPEDACGRLDSGVERVVLDHHVREVDGAIRANATEAHVIISRIDLARVSDRADLLRGALDHVADLLGLGGRSRGILREVETGVAQHQRREPCGVGGATRATVERQTVGVPDGGDRYVLARCDHADRGAVGRSVAHVELVRRPAHHDARVGAVSRIRDGRRVGVAAPADDDQPRREGRVDGASHGWRVKHVGHSAQ